jgi:hypothetical protein
MITGHFYPSLQGFCVSCLFCFANMDVHYAILPLLKQLFGSGFGGDSAMMAQRANTVTHSTRDLCVWLCCRTRRTISDQHSQELEMYWPKQAMAFSLLSASDIVQSKLTVTGHYYAVAVVTTSGSTLKWPNWPQSEPVPYLHGLPLDPL